MYLPSLGIPTLLISFLLLFYLSKCTVLFICLDSGELKVLLSPERQIVVIMAVTKPCLLHQTTSGQIKGVYSIKVSILNDKALYYMI